VWGRTKKRDAWGRKKQSDRPASDWVVTTIENLRIVSDELWAAAHEALQTRQKKYGFKAGQPRQPSAIDSKYLLTGMVDCGVCGGTIVQTWSGRKPVYRCWYNHSRGRAVCSNSVLVDMHLADETVLQAVGRDVLDPEVVNEALELALRELQQQATPDEAQIGRLKNELVRVEGELSRYAEAIADVGPLAAILEAIKVREQRRDAIRTELRTVAPPRAVSRADAEIRSELMGYLENWRAMARQSVAEARRLLRAVLVGRFVFTPVTPPPDLLPRKGPGRKPRFI